MKYIIPVLALLMSSNLYAGEQPVDGSRDEPIRGVIMVEDAIETESLRISLSANLHGFVEGKVCDECETIKVPITPETKAFSGDVEVPLIKAKNRIGRPATVFYDIETKNVTRIRW
jgi:hypothetical protein